MNQKNRLDKGGHICRNTPLKFIYNGKEYTGFKGDTIASALLANGVNIVGRSFKYRRPRGIISAASEEPNAILQLGASEESQVANIKATEQQLFDGLVCYSVKGWPSVNFDFISLFTRLFSKIMIPGFYYKTFMFPKFMYKTYGKYLRKAAGMGRSSIKQDPDIYDNLNHHPDILIVGAGPSGLAAALSAAKTNAKILIADEQEQLGGSLLSSRRRIDNKSAARWLAETLEELYNYGNVNILTNAVVNGYHDHNFLTINQTLVQSEDTKYNIRQRLHRIRAKVVILATGAHERTLVFSNNDRPGCMQAAAVSTYINRYGVIPGNKLILMTTNDYAYQAAFDWQDSGREVVAIIDTRTDLGSDNNSYYLQEANKRKLKIIPKSAVIEVKGKKRVNGALIANISSDGREVISKPYLLHCDTIASSGGWSPIIHLSCHTGTRPKWQDDIQGFIPGETNQDNFFVGGANGIYSLKRCIEDGLDIGLEAAIQAGFNSKSDIKMPKIEEHNELKGMALFHVPHIYSTCKAPKKFVDYQTDVTAEDIKLTIREGFNSIEHIKRYTAMGFGTDQGKLGNINGMAIAADIMGQSIPETGTTVFRPNYTPVTFGAIAGRNCQELFEPKRYTPIHSWHVKNNAKFEDVGQWKRAWYYPKDEESMADAIRRECLATRNSVGIFDASTLGKIDIQGKDAREFISRVYTNAWAKLAVGKCRYGLMCGEDGMVFDDGVTACLAEDHFLMTTTTGGAAHVLSWLEMYHQTEWPDLQVYLNSVTDNWSTITISGPKARHLLSEVCDDINLDKSEFKFMDWRQGTVAGVPARVFRISFTGELSYEINVQANYGLHIWNILYKHGQKYNITPYGTETMHVLRAEKGFIIIGQDTDGSVTPIDLGMSWCVNNKKPYSYIGKRGMNRADCKRDNRKQLIGLKTKSPKTVIPEGSQAVANPNEPIPMTMLGHVTSSYYSDCLQRSIAMGFVINGHNKVGDIVYYPQADGTVIEAEICNPIFYDPKGEQQNV